MQSFLVISSVLLWVVVLFNLLLTMAVVRKTSQLDITENHIEKIETLKAGDLAPDFVAINLDGIGVSLADYSGKNVAFIVVSSSCSPCLEKITEVEKLLPKAQNAGVEVVFVSIDDLPTAKTYFKGLNIVSQAIVASAAENTFIEDYKVLGTPYFCLVDGQGVILDAGLFDQKWYKNALNW